MKKGTNLSLVRGNLAAEDRSGCQIATRLRLACNQHVLTVEQARCCVSALVVAGTPGIPLRQLVDIGTLEGFA